jgi:excisionase family DNA binding protein
MQAEVHAVERTEVRSVGQEASVPEVLTPAEAAEYLRYPIETLRMWRYRGTGPRYFRAGNHVRYRRAALDRWIEERERESARGA